jgi:hypothetical protein
MSCDHIVYLLEDESHALNLLPVGTLSHISGQVEIRRVMSPALIFSLGRHTLPILL